MNTQVCPLFPYVLNQQPEAHRPSLPKMIGRFIIERLIREYPSNTMEDHPGQGPKAAVIEDYLGELLKRILSTSGWYLLCIPWCMLLDL